MRQKIRRIGLEEEKQRKMRVFFFFFGFAC
jgi:hypothetical protein